MKWVTRARPKVDRVACPWLIKRFVDPAAEFLYVPADQVMEIAKREGAIPFDVANVELGHDGLECTFDAIMKKYNLSDRALQRLARRGRHLLARLLAWLLRMPLDGRAILTRLIITPCQDGEKWHRIFDGRSLISKQRERAGGLLAERTGIVEIWFRLEVMDRALCFNQTGAALCLESLHVRLPRKEIPISATCLRCGYRLELRILKSSPGDGGSLLLGDEVKSLIDNPIGWD